MKLNSVKNQIFSQHRTQVGDSVSDWISTQVKSTQVKYRVWAQVDYHIRKSLVSSQGSSQDLRLGSSLVSGQGIIR